jgi:hypothetical protein
MAVSIPHNVNVSIFFIYSTSRNPVTLQSNFEKFGDTASAATTCFRWHGDYNNYCRIARQPEYNCFRQNSLQFGPSSNNS